MSKYKAIISDIDGTLTLSQPDAKPTPKVKDAIRRATKKGLIFSIASARPYNLLSYLIEDIPLRSLIIINNGAEIYDTRTKKPVWESTIPLDIAFEIFKYAKHFQKYHVDLSRQELINPETLSPNAKIFKFVIFNLRNSEADQLISTLRKKFSTISFTKAGSHFGVEFVDVYIANGNATKQHAVLKFAEALNISTNEIIGIGDHYNDFPLLMACGLKVAMGNAVEDLKAIADYIAPSVEADGVADVIEKFIE